ncbi:hypothetical protein A5881_002300 [Enterococcus termitis]
MEYLSTSEFAKLWNMSSRRVQVLASTGRVNGAKKKSGVWLIPQNAIKPTTTKSYDFYERTIKNRRMLKQLLKKSYIKFGAQMDPSEFRLTVIVTLHANIIEETFSESKISNKEYVAKYVYNWMKGESNKTIDMTLFSELFDYFKEYIHNSNGDILNTLSWSYQYLNDILNDNNFAKTQFFTEQYMIEFLMKNFQEKYSGGIIFDPCCGGGNMLTAILEKLNSYGNQNVDFDMMKLMTKKIIGFDIDENLAYITILNIRIKCLELLTIQNVDIDFETWSAITPEIYYPNSTTLTGTLDNDCVIKNRLTGEEIKVSSLLGRFEIVITNPPFATIKGMDSTLNTFLKQNFPNSNSDMCVAFIDKVSRFLSAKGTAFMVVQNSWMFLNSFENFRKDFLGKNCINEILDLGSGAFLDITGEKSSIALLTFESLQESGENKIYYQSLKNRSIKEKIEGSINHKGIYVNQSDVFNNEYSRFDFMNVKTFKDFYYSGGKIKDFAVPMQGTSTGDSKKLVGYFWEHLGDHDWKLVSKGGGYSRWQGLNRYVVKWGIDGAFIKNQKGSVLRNVKYFPDTELVFSDTGTSGLNVRLLMPSQLFIASGPGIRFKSGNKYAVMAVLNSRLTSYYMRILSPKLTIAAGYIANIPITQEMALSRYLATQAKICVESKKLFLMNRPNNIEYSDEYFDTLPNKINKAVEQLMVYELKLELQKLESEKSIEDFILAKSGISKNDTELLFEEMGIPAYNISQKKNIDISEIDKKWKDITNWIGVLNKTRVSKYDLGIDGSLEFLSKNFNTNPKMLVETIEENISEFVLMKQKYFDLIMHNSVLTYLKYNIITGVEFKKVESSKIIQFICERFLIEKNIAEEWLENRFSCVHSNIFLINRFFIKKSIMEKVI